MELGTMWNIHFAPRIIAKNRIEWKPGLQDPLHCVPYQAGAIVQKLEGSEIDKIFKMKVAQPCETECAAPTLLAKKNMADLDFVRNMES